jgi:hypothetical protein
MISLKNKLRHFIVQWEYNKKPWSFSCTYFQKLLNEHSLMLPYFIQEEYTLWIVLDRHYNCFYMQFTASVDQTSNCLKQAKNVLQLIFFFVNYIASSPTSVLKCFELNIMSSTAVSTHVSSSLDIFTSYHSRCNENSLYLWTRD